MLLPLCYGIGMEEECCPIAEMARRFDDEMQAELLERFGGVDGDPTGADAPEEDAR